MDGSEPTSAEPLPAANDAAITPMMARFLEVKRAYPDCLVFYRMGDFYEMFFDDAVNAARALDITLTKRGKHQGGEIPMAGVPVHAAEAYLARLIRKGFRVAICEQVEDPAEAKKRGAKSPVRREVVRVVTPGTLTEDSLLDARRNNYLAAVADAAGGLALARADLSTGEFAVEPVDRLSLGAALARLDASEILVPERLVAVPELYELWADWRQRLTPLPGPRFDSENARRRLETRHGVSTLDGLGSFTRAEIAAAGALLDYVELTQMGSGAPGSATAVPLRPLIRVAAAATLEIDPATARNLELTRTLAGERSGSLLAAIDRTVTGVGARTLHRWLAQPLARVDAIVARQDAVAWFVDRPGARQDVRGFLNTTPDLERPLSRLVLGRGGPRDLAAIRDGLDAARRLRGVIADAAQAESTDMADGSLPALLAEETVGLGQEAVLIERLGRALKPDLPLLSRDGDFIAPGYAPDLDHLRSLRDDSRRLIANLQARYASETGVATLKIRHNGVLGYYVEVGAAHADKLREPFIHRQTMAGAARFTTVELAELESQVAKAGDQALALEERMFADLVGEVTARGEPIARAAAAIGVIDTLAALADLAVDRGYARPLVDDGTAFRIEGGRHPVVEAMLPGGSQTFIANDCDLTGADGRDAALWLITGPNMAGKSTFLRQNALIAILAQIGAFVPATSAHIGVVDRVFSRVGAADDLARGRSTFMVEMVETAAILNQASPRSLVILDEIGRGTATFDGLSIAWATVEHLHDVNRCRALFATHYHELTSLQARLAGLTCHTMRIKEWQGDVVFLHEVAAGSADRSYGVHVAKLAGLPPAVLARAEEVLTHLEQDDRARDLKRLADDLPLFSMMAKPAATAPAADPKLVALADALRDLDPDSMAPRQALEALYGLKTLLS